MSRMDRIRVGRTMADLRRQLRNWYIVGPLTWTVMLSPARRLLEGSALARWPLKLRFREGRTLRCRINDMQAFVEVFLLGDYEVEGMRWADVRTIVDVGANVGMASIWFADRCPEASIVAVEPGSDAGSLLHSNLAANHLGGRVRVIPVALGGADGSGRLEQARSSVLSRLVDDANEGPVVQVRTLKRLVEDAGLDTIDVLKLDCEGSEYDILLSSSPDLLARIRCVVGEWHPSAKHRPEELTDHLENAGYTVTAEPHPTLEGFGNFAAVRNPA